MWTLLWLRDKVAALDENTKGIRERHDASDDTAERAALARDLMIGLWTRGSALERQGEFMIELVPDRADEFGSRSVTPAPSSRSRAKHLWGDPSQQ